MCALRRLALTRTELAQATCGSIRLTLLKIGAQITVSVRHVKIALASSYPLQALFVHAHEQLARYLPQVRLRQDRRERAGGPTRRRRRASPIRGQRPDAEHKRGQEKPQREGRFPRAEALERNAWLQHRP
jgi:hypothetical protein